MKKEIIDRLIKNAEQGDAEAHYKLGMLCSFTYVDNLYPELKHLDRLFFCRPHYERATSMGHVNANIFLKYWNTIFKADDKQHQLKYLKQSAATNNFAALTMLGRNHANNGNYSDACQCFIDAYDSAKTLCTELAEEVRLRISDEFLKNAISAEKYCSGVDGFFDWLNGGREATRTRAIGCYKIAASLGDPVAIAAIQRLADSGCQISVSENKPALEKDNEEQQALLVKANPFERLKNKY